MVSFEDIAKKAGCSKATVSYVFNNVPQVGEDTRKRVLAAARKLNYRPKTSSRKLKIAIFTHNTIFNPFNYYENTMLLSILSAINRQGYDSQILETPDLLRNGNFQGALILMPQLSEKVTKEICNMVPSIVINRSLKKINWVSSKNKEAIFNAVELLVQNSHSRIGILVGDKTGNNISYRHRLDGYFKAIKHFSLDSNEQFIQEYKGDASSGTAGVVEPIAKMMKASPTAIIAAGEGLDLIVNYGLYVLDKKIPEDISVISYENNRSFILTPPHTTVSQNFTKLGERAVANLIALVRGEKKGFIQEAIDCQIIQRESVKNLKQTYYRKRIAKN